MEDVPFTCPVCGEEFSRREGYHRKKHLEGHQLTLVWKCARCNYKTGSRRFHDHVKHWHTRHFGSPEPPVAEVVPDIPAEGDTRRVTRSSRSPPTGSRSSRGRHSPRVRSRESPARRESQRRRSAASQDPEPARRRRPTRSATVSRPPSTPERPAAAQLARSATASRPPSPSPRSVQRQPHPSGRPQ